ncbi:hypothetical protein V1478_012141 [Vespula squamosa]|uniref:Uncharacterized protein n=1 Tax=Vespula squamosa TaxID=30214 RepID=A0ABD2AF03_VESSQ
MKHRVINHRVWALRREARERQQNLNFENDDHTVMRTCLKTVAMVTRQLACLPACTSMLAAENCCDKPRRGNC